MDSIRPFNKEMCPKDPSWDPWSPMPLEHLDLELGCGTGDFALTYAEAHPSRHLVAIERTNNKSSVFKNRHGDSRLSNLTSIHGDAVRWIAHNVPDGSVSRAFILYPNPYPKEKQANQRWHNMPFMGELISKLKADGEITYVTNEKWLIDEARERFLSSWNLQILSEIEIRQGDRTWRTRFEKKYLERGQTCFELVLGQKTDSN